MTGRLVHSLAVVTPRADRDGDLDEYGQPLSGEPEVVAFSGLLQPRSAREVALSSQGGATVATHVCFAPRSVAVSTAAHIRRVPDDGIRFEVTAVRDLAFGGLAHKEIDLRVVGSPEVEAS